MNNVLSCGQFPFTHSPQRTVARTTAARTLASASAKVTSLGRLHLSLEAFMCVTVVTRPRVGLGKMACKLSRVFSFPISIYPCESFLPSSGAGVGGVSRVMSAVKRVATASIVLREVGFNIIQLLTSFHSTEPLVVPNSLQQNSSHRRKIEASSKQDDGNRRQLK
jgi:hypothetical protein